MTVTFEGSEVSETPLLPFVAAPVGPLPSARAAAEHAATHWKLPRPELMRVGMNALFTAGPDVVLRVSRPTADPTGAVRLAEQLTDLGLRVPGHVSTEVVSHDGLAVYAVRREHPVGEVDWRSVGAMVAAVHRIDPATVADGYPVPRCHTFPWWDFDALLADVGDLLDAPARAGIGAAIERHRGWTSTDEPKVLCHGDVHPGNVIPTADGPVLIDWDLLCTGPAGWDHGPLMTWTERWGGEPGIYEAFADGYGRSLRGDRAAEAAAELRLVAATLMRVRAGRSDETAATEAERRLRWWRGDPDAPSWRAA